MSTPADTFTDRTGATDEEFQARVAVFDAADAPESFDAVAAVRRVEALADEWDTDADARYSQNRIAKSTAARVLRATLAPQAGEES